jgi:hypothetical protein
MSECDKLLAFRLKSQFVAIPDKEELFHVIRGSGMGLIHSGEVSDVSCFELCGTNMPVIP